MRQTTGASTSTSATVGFCTNTRIAQEFGAVQIKNERGAVGLVQESRTDAGGRNGAPVQ
jgi:hypothetical protein